MKKIAIFLFLLFSTYCTHSQLNEKLKPYFQWFDDVTDARNSSLSDGTSYIEAYKTKKGHHQYYLTADFLTADLTYDGQLYGNVNLQYNLFTDQLILRYYKKDNIRTIQLIKDKVKEFIVDGRKFVAIKKQPNGKAEYCEVLFEGKNLKLLKKHFKKRQKHIENGLVYYSFKKKSNLLALIDGEISKVDTKKSILKLLPNDKKVITNFSSKNNYLYNNNRDQFMKLLFQQIANQ